MTEGDLLRIKDIEDEINALEIKLKKARNNLQFQKSLCDHKHPDGSSAWRELPMFCSVCDLCGASNM